MKWQGCASARLLIAAILGVPLMIHAASAAAQDDTAHLNPAWLRAEYERTVLGQPDLPAIIRDAFLAAEDRNFFDRPALRSTITRDIAKRYVIADAAPANRALEVMAVQAAIADTLDHDEILTWYIAGLYLGRQCHGARGAAQAYFGLSLGDLSVSQAALLAGLAASPGRFDPVRAPDRAQDRRNTVLREMAQMGAITDQQANLAISAPLQIRDPLGGCPPRHSAD